VLLVLAGCGGPSQPAATTRSGGDTAAGRAPCLPRDGSLLAQAPRFTLVSTRPGVTVCTRSTGTRMPLSEDAIDVATAAYGSYAAATEDVCPGGFEGCWVGIVVLRLPSRQVVTKFEFGTSVGRLAAGRGGALALLTCTPLDENAECLPGARDEQALYRLDGRGLKQIASGPRIDARSLRTAPGGRGFTWREAGRLRTARWTGSPPARLR
jgi:hypothetical protein